MPAICNTLRPRGVAPLRHLAARLALTAALVAVAAAEGAGAKSLIAQAREQGLLDVETAAVYEVLDQVAPELLPDQYRGAPELHFCGTPALIEANHLRASASPANQQLLGKVLQRPPTSDELLTPSGRFRIHYSTSGRDGVDTTDVSGNGIPDYVDTVSAVLEYVWDLEVEALGYQAPPADGGAGGGPELDVYLLDLGRLSYYGLTYPESSGPTTSSYLQLDNDYTNSVYGQAGYCPASVGTRGLDALRVTVAHEFFHMIQFGYYQGRDGSWWQEACSTWMEDVAYPEADDYLQYVCAFLGASDRSLDSGRPLSGDYQPYGASIFVHFLERRYERDLVRWIWEELGRRASADLSHFERVFAGVDDDGLAGAVADFGLWNYFTGDRHRSGFYPEGEKYPEPASRTLSVAPKATVADSGDVDHLASAYVNLRPHGAGGISLSTELERGSWQRQLVLASDDTLEIRELGETGPVTVPDWEVYEEIVLVVTNTDVSGLGYDYRVSVEYDPEMAGGDAPLASRIGDPYPNPYRPRRDEAVLLPFQLHRTSPLTQVSVYAADGRLVRSYDLGYRARNRDPLDWYRQEWDGRNQRGEPVGSGIYHWVLEANGASMSKSVAVVRD